jgi:hypothetical protein
MHKKKNGDTHAHTGQHDSDETKTLVHGAIQVHAAPDLIEKHEAERKEDAAKQSNQHNISKWTLGAVIVYSALTLVLVILSACNNIIARNAMRQSQRPWIGPYRQVPLITGPIIIDDKGIRVDYRMSAVNYGSFGANNVNFWAQLYVAQDISTIGKRSKYACENSTSNPDMGRVLFPGQDTAMVNAWPAFTMDIIPNKNANPPQKLYQAYLLACIGYRDQFGIPHHTGTIYRSTPPGGIGGDSVVFELTPNQTIPVEWHDWHSFLD